MRISFLIKTTTQTSQILNSVQEGNGFSSKTLWKSRFHCQNDWSGNGTAGQFWQMESALRLRSIKMIWIRIRKRRFDECDHSTSKFRTNESSAGNNFFYSKGCVSFQTLILEGHIWKLVGHSLAYCIYLNISTAALMAFIWKLDMQRIVLTMILLFALFN